MAAAELIPATVMVFDVIGVFNATSVWSVNTNAFGVVSAASVVTLNVSDMPPIVSTASVLVLKLADDVCCTLTILPLFTVPAVEVYEPPLMAYSPPVIDIAAAVLMPATVIVFDVIGVFKATPVWS